MRETFAKRSLLRNNLLTYYENKVKKTALKNLLTHLCPSGFLIIGPHEKLPFETLNFVIMEDFRIYSKSRTET